jgi:phosphoglucosamine mutase
MRQLFGTDGVRGIANQHPMTVDMALKLGKAAAIILGNGNKRPMILIGKDTRLSGYMIEYALTSGIISMGADVLLVGPMPTPAIAHLTKSFAADAGIVISASHNPAEHNGIKFFDKNGHKLSDDIEEKIEELVFSNNFNHEHIIAEKIGKVKRIDDAKGRYIEFAKSAIENNSLKGLKVVVDCANGAAYDVSPQIFKELGAEVIAINVNPNGLNINKECGSLYPDKLKEYVLKEKADLGIALDGDADRIIFVDEKGNEVDGDQIMALCALELKKQNQLRKNTVVATVMSNIGFDILMKENEINVIRTNVGDRYVFEVMRKEGYNFGGENSGHLIFLDSSTTGDGTIAALRVLDILKRSNKKLSELTRMKKYPQVLKNIEVKEKKPIEELDNVFNKIKEVENRLKDKGRVNVRYSGTENKARVLVEGEAQDEIESLADEIIKEIEKVLT